MLIPSFRTTYSTLKRTGLQFSAYNSLLAKNSCRNPQCGLHICIWHAWRQLAMAAISMNSPVEHSLGNTAHLFGAHIALLRPWSNFLRNNRIDSGMRCHNFSDNSSISKAAGSDSAPTESLYLEICLHAHSYIEQSELTQLYIIVSLDIGHHFCFCACNKYFEFRSVWCPL